VNVLNRRGPGVSQDAGSAPAEEMGMNSHLYLYEGRKRCPARPGAGRRRLRWRPSGHGHSVLLLYLSSVVASWFARVACAAVITVAPMPSKLTASSRA
jgi:hypothetical protein